MKVSIPGFIYCKPASEWELDNPDVIDGHRMIFSAYEGMTSQKYVMVCPHVMEFEIPEGWDSRAQRLDALRAHEQDLRKDFAAEIAKVQQQIASLLAIEMAPA